MAAITIIGIGDNGCVGMTSKAYNCLQKAQVLVGGKRHLDFFSDFKGRRLCFDNGLLNTIDEIEKESEENSIVVLSSGDPLFFGVADLITKRIGIEHVEIIPTCSSIQLAFSKIGKKWDDAKIISLHGKSITGLANKVFDEYKVGLLTDNINTPEVISNYLCKYGQTDWKVTICENLEGPTEKITQYDINDINGNFSKLNVVILLRDPKKIRPRKVTAHVEDKFKKRIPKKGLITKREIRGLVLMNLELRKDSIVWDIGAGSGSVAIESALIAREGKVYAVETNEECIDMCYENIKSFNTDNVEVIHALAPSGVDKLPAPDAVFIGGTKGKMKEIIELSYQKLKEEGIIVISAILMDSIVKIIEILKENNFDYEVQLIQISRGHNIANSKRYDALNPIHLFTLRKGRDL